MITCRLKWYANYDIDFGRENIFNMLEKIYLKEPTLERVPTKYTIRFGNNTQNITQEVYTWE